MVNNLEYVRGTVMIVSVDPTALFQGLIWFNTTDKQLKLYNGTSVVILG